MKFIYDMEFANGDFPIGHHFIDSTLLETVLDGHPDGIQLKVKTGEMLQYFKDHPDARKKAGWDNPSRIPGLPKGTSCWQALLNQLDYDNTPAEMKALNLK